MQELLHKKYPNLALLILRFAAGGIFAYEGAIKLFVLEPSSVVGYFAGLGFPFPEFVAPLITYFEFFGGLLIFLGLFTRVLSLLAAGEMVVAAVVANLPLGITASSEVNILLFTMFFALFFVGGGKFSLARFLRECNCGKFLPFAGIAIVPLLAFSVFAAGGGGGGGGGGGSGAPPPPPPCEEDTWTCANWSECTISGTQTRTCTLISNCPTAETPKPAESQSCTPPAAAEPKPQEPQVPVVPPVTPAEEACTNDEYQCGDWSQCQFDGRQRRSCSISKDCPAVFSKKPDETKLCPGLRCGHLLTLKERISCRLGLTQKELAQEFSVLYAPEYCKVEETKEEKNKCIRFYQEVGPCWKLPPGSARVQCAKGVIRVGSVREEAKVCGASSNSAACIADLKEKIENLIIFRLYELEVQAETLMIDWGVPKEEVSALELFIETKKQEIEKTDDTKEWKKVILETKVRWQKFINDSRPYINS